MPRLQHIFKKQISLSCLTFALRPGGKGSLAAEALDAAAALAEPAGMMVTSSDTLMGALALPELLLEAEGGGGGGLFSPFRLPPE